MKISIVTATYNSGESLRDTLESVLSQTYDDYEHIIVDGGSTDNTLDILREYEPRYNGRLKWHSEPDRGIYDAMNKGITRATGELVGLLNSDDFYTSDDVLASIAENYQSGGGRCRVWRRVLCPSPRPQEDGASLQLRIVQPLEDAPRFHACPSVILLSQKCVYASRDV